MDNTYDWFANAQVNITFLGVCVRFWNFKHKPDYWKPRE